jgi:uncharacterized protein DUF1579
MIVPWAPDIASALKIRIALELGVRILYPLSAKTSIRGATVYFRTVLAIIFLSGFALAQMPAEPNPELKKLEYFVGTWTAEGTISPGPWGEGGKFSVSHTYSWMAGNFFLESHSEFKMPPDLGGDSESTGFIAYDAEKRSYTSTEFSSQGGRGVAQGDLKGDTWTWTSSEKHDGQEIKQRSTNKILSPNSYIARFEVSVDGTHWVIMMESKVIKK